MSTTNTYSIHVLGPNQLKGCWPVRFFYKHLIDAILAESYLTVEYPMKLLCTIHMETATFISKKQKVIFTDAEIIDTKLRYKKLHIANIDKHKEFFNITKNECNYTGFFGINEIESFKISLSETFDMRDILSDFIRTVEKIKKIFETQTNISALDVLKIIINTLQINLSDIKYLNLSTFLKVKNGRIVFTKKIFNSAIITRSVSKFCYTDNDFSFEYPLKVLYENYANNSTAKNNSDGYSLTIFGCKNIRNSNAKTLFDKALVELNRYEKELNKFISVESNY